MNLTQQYIENFNKIQTISIEKKHLYDANKKVSHEITYAYQDKIRALENLRDNEIEELDKKHNAQITELVEQSTELITTIKEVERILMFLAIKPHEVIIENESLKIIYSDEWLKIGALISQNKKPKNKYTLHLSGISMFVGGRRKNIFKNPHCTNQWGHVKISEYLKDFPSEKEAEAYFIKHKDTIGKEIIDEYKAIKKEYKQILATYTLDDFRPLFIVECKACGSFVTKYNEDYYSRSIQDGTCYNCDIHIKDANKIARMPKKDLPLYINHKWRTESAKEFFLKRFNEVMTST